MEYLVDGYNLLFRIAPTASNVESARKELVSFLSEIPLKIRVVFDCPKEGASDLPIRSKHGPLEILFSPSDLCADRYLLEIISLCRKPKETTLVTSDRPLANAAKEHGVKILSIEEFLELVHRKTKKTSDKPTYQESDFEKEALRKEFERRLRENN